MKKSILNIGTALNKAEQKQINGGMMLSGCASGSALYFLSGTSNCCAYPSSIFGEVCYGRVTNNYCNLGPKCS